MLYVKLNTKTETEYKLRICSSHFSINFRNQPS
jgi:hypothetical protein